MGKKDALEGFDTDVFKVRFEQADCDLCAEKKGCGFQDCACFYLKQDGDEESLLFVCGKCLGRIVAVMEGAR